MSQKFSTGVDPGFITGNCITYFPGGVAVLGSSEMVSTFPLTVIGNIFARARLDDVFTLDAAEIMKPLGAVIFNE